jgi:polyhydroxyalkanoate synthesis repressor PhaR
MRMIKRYPNRKLYDTEQSRYITLEKLATLVRSGEEIRVVGHRSGADLTAATFAQIIFEEEKKTPRLSIPALCEIIRRGLAA